MSTVPAKSRHGCLTAYLLFLIVTNALAAIFLTLGLGTSGEGSTTPVGWRTTYIGLSALGLVGAIGLWKWQRWGFWLYLASAVLTLGASTAAGIDRAHFFSQILVVAVLYAVLHIGKTNRGWPQLE